MAKLKRGECPKCLRDVALTNDGTTREHTRTRAGKQRCSGSRTPVVAPRGRPAGRRQTPRNKAETPHTVSAAKAATQLAHAGMSELAAALASDGDTSRTSGAVDIDGRALVLGCRVEMLDSFGHGTGSAGNIVELGKPYATGRGCPVVVERVGKAPSSVGSYQVRLAPSSMMKDTRQKLSLQQSELAVLLALDRRTIQRMEKRGETPGGPAGVIWLALVEHADKPRPARELTIDGKTGPLRFWLTRTSWLTQPNRRKLWRELLS